MQKPPSLIVYWARGIYVLHNLVSLNIYIVQLLIFSQSTNFWKYFLFFKRCYVMLKDLTKTPTRDCKIKQPNKGLSASFRRNVSLKKPNVYCPKFNDDFKQFKSRVSRVPKTQNSKFML